MKAGTELNGREYEVHLDDYNMLPYWKGEVDESPRKQYLYFSDTGDLCAARIIHWKIVWLQQRATGTMQVWREPYTELRVPLIFNLRTDRFERANLTSNAYEDWFIDHAYMMGLPSSSSPHWPSLWRSFRGGSCHPASVSTG